VRDTSTVPCFLAEDDGELYYLGIQQDITSDFHPPQLKHDVLVEGTVVSGPRVCGGIPLSAGFHLRHKGSQPGVQHTAAGRAGIDAPPASRGPGPSSRRPDPVSAPRQALTGSRSS